MKEHGDSRAGGLGQATGPHEFDLAGLKVCFLAGTLGQGGAERQLFYMLRALKENRAVPRVLCLDRGGFWEKPIQDLGVPVTWVGQSATKIGRLRRLLRELRQDPPAIIQSQHFYMNAYARAAAFLLRARSIGALRSNGVMDVEDCGRMAGWLNLTTPQVIAANSEAALRFAVAEGLNSTKLYLLPSVVPPGQRRPYSRGLGPVRLLAVGRLIRAKRFDRVLTVLARLRAHLKQEVKGTIVGDGPLLAELQAQAKDLGLSPASIEFRGSAADVAPFYREADIFLLTSDYEGTPNVLLEAMAAGLPVVATRVGGVPEILQFGENGISVDPDDLGELQSALTRLAQDPALRAGLGSRGRSYVEANHSPQQLPLRLSRLYQLALADKARPGRAPASPGHEGGTGRPDPKAGA